MLKESIQKKPHGHLEGGEARLRILSTSARQSQGAQSSTEGITESWPA